MCLLNAWHENKRTHQHSIHESNACMAMLFPTHETSRPELPVFAVVVLSQAFWPPGSPPTSIFLKVLFRAHSVSALHIAFRALCQTAEVTSTLFEHTVLSTSSISASSSMCSAPMQFSVDSISSSITAVKREFCKQNLKHSSGKREHRPRSVSIAAAHRSIQHKWTQTSNATHD